MSIQVPFFSFQLIKTSELPWEYLLKCLWSAEVSPGQADREAVHEALLYCDCGQCWSGVCGGDATDLPWICCIVEWKILLYNMIPGKTTKLSTNNYIMP